MIPDVEVLGAKFTAVVRIRQDVHRWRSHHGWGPELNPSWFRSWAEPSEHDHVPVPAVDLLGALVPVAHPRFALRACGTLLTLAPCAVVLPSQQPYRPLRMLELDYYGVGAVNVAENGLAELVIAPEDRTAEFGSSLFGRWLLEVLYSRLLEHPQLTENA
nr:hypothetical protein [Saccharopolyspora hordei]